MESLLNALRGAGIGRVAAMAGGAAGVAAILIAVMLRVGAQPKSLLYANLDLKEASQITGALDQAGVKYEVKGDGSTIMVDRDRVASTRLLLSGKGLPTSGSVGYEIFDSAPALGQTDFVQNLNRQRALEGELARTIRAIQGVNFVRVHLVMPKKQLFEDDNETPSASILVATNGGRVGGEQVRAIRNLVAAAVPDLKPDRVAIADQQGELLAGEGDEAVGDAGGSARTQVEERIRKRIKDLVEGVVGPGKARVQVSADLDLAHVTVQEEKYDPDGQVVRSTETRNEKTNESKSSTSGMTSASQNVPGADNSSNPNGDSSNTGRQEETTNYEISKTTRTEVEEPGQVKRLSVAVAVDGATGPSAGGKPGPYHARTADEMKQIDQLVRSAMGFDQARGDQATVVNVRFDPSAADEGVASASAFNFDKNDVMRGAELGVLGVVAALIIFFVARPMLSSGVAGPQIARAFAPATPRLPSAGGAQPALAMAGQGAALALPGPGTDSGIDIAKIEGQVRVSSVKKVAEFVEKHPEESISILRSWLHEG